MGGIDQEAYYNIIFGLIISGWPNAKIILGEGCHIKRIYGSGCWSEVLQPLRSIASELWQLASKWSICNTWRYHDFIIHPWWCHHHKNNPCCIHLHSRVVFNVRDKCFWGRAHSQDIWSKSHQALLTCMPPWGGNV